MPRFVATSLVLLICSTFVVTHARGQEGEAAPPRVDLLDVLPADTWGTLAVPDLRRFDQRLNAFMQPLQVPMMMGPPVTMAKMLLGLQAGFDDNGGFAVVMLPPVQGQGISQSLVILLPTTNYQAMMKGMSAEATNDGASKIFFAERTSFAIPYRERFAAVAQNRNALNRLTGMKGVLRTRFNDEQTRRWRDNDMTIWVNAKEVMANPMTTRLLQAAKQMGMATSEQELKDLGQLQFHATFDPKGLTLGGYADAQSGTQLAKVMASVPGTNESLLKGLPNEKYIAAMGFQSSRTYAEMSAKSLENSIRTFMEGQGLEADKWMPATTSLTNLAKFTTSLSADVVALPDDRSGTLAANIVIRTNGNAGAFITTLADMVGQVKTGVEGIDDDEAKEIASLVSYTKNAEKQGGSAVDHLTFTLPDDADQHVKEMVKKIFGEANVIVRVSRASDDNVVMTIGGGVDQTAALLASARSDGAPLAKAKGIATASTRVGNRRTMEMYVAVDRLLQVMTKLDPAQMNGMVMPTVDAPLVLHGNSIDERSASGAFFVPMDLIVAMKNAFMNAMVQPMGAQPNDPPPADRMPDQGDASM